MKRLTVRKDNHVHINTDVIARTDCTGKYGFHFCQYSKNCPSISSRKCPVLRVLDKLADYEDEKEARLNELKDLPTEDVAPVVHGKWKIVKRHRGGFRKYTGYDEMGNMHTITVDERHEVNDKYCPECGKWNDSQWDSYCPNCGAKMDLKGEK